MKVRGIKLPFISFLVSLIPVVGIVSASNPDTGLLSYISTTDLVMSTPFLDFNLWVLITLLGVLFLIMSNVCTDEQAPKLWAILSPLFFGPSTYFTLFLRKTVVTTYFNSSSELHVNSINIITHPEWLCILMAIITIISCVNLWMALSKKPIEKTRKEDFLGDQRL